MRRTTPLIVLLQFALWPLSGADHGTLRVGIHEKPPYAYQDADGNWQGLGVELWNGLAKANGYNFIFQGLPFESLIPGLVDGSLDLVVGELIVNPEDEQVMDFSQPFMETSMLVAVSRKHWSPTWWHLLSRVWSPTLWKAAAGVVLAMLCAGFLIWICERKRSGGHFGGGGARGIGSAFWFSAVTMTGVGYGDKVPTTVPGRLVAMVWMFCGLLLVTGLAATVAATIATAQNRTTMTRADDLRHYTNGVLNGGAADRFLQNLGAPTVAFESIENGLAAVAGGRIDTFVGDGLSLRYLISREYAGQVSVLPMELATSRVAFGLPQKSLLREDLNVALLRFERGAEWPALLQKYGQPAITPP